MVDNKKLKGRVGIKGRTAGRVVLFHGTLTELNGYDPHNWRIAAQRYTFFAGSPQDHGVLVKNEHELRKSLHRDGYDGLIHYSIISNFSAPNCIIYFGVPVIRDFGM